MKARLCGKVWSLRDVPNLGSAEVPLLGDCSDPREPNKTIRIRQGLSEEEELDVTIHECLHAAQWSLDEEFVAEFASDVARILYRRGYRKGGAK